MLAYFRVHKILDGLDQRWHGSSRARRGAPPQDEALALLAVQNKQHEAEQEGKSVIAGAGRKPSDCRRGQADRRPLSRRTKMAETKIAQAETQALADVRAAAADAAVAAAERILGKTVKGKLADDLINKGVEDLKSKLN